jgi:hypothetical protein
MSIDRMSKSLGTEYFFKILSIEFSLNLYFETYVLIGVILGNFKQVKRRSLKRCLSPSI